MLKNYLAAALRNLARNRLYAAINVIGLAIGFAAALLIALFVRHETTFDNFIPGHENIYRVSSAVSFAGNGSNATEDVPGSLSEWMKVDFPQIQSIARLARPFEGVSVRHGEVESIEHHFYYADPDFFEVVPLPVYAGNLKTALDRPDGLVITRRMARVFFGTDSPIGETLEVERLRTLTVTAVLEDLPSNTHLNTEMIASGKARNSDSWPRSYVYLRLKPGVSADQMRRQLVDFVDRHFPKLPFGKMSDAFSLPLVPIGEIHLRPPGAFAMTPAGEPRTICAVALTGALILLLAIINFVNLKTARAARRAVEVGVRKACGARRRDLVFQFMGESLIYATFAMLVAMALVELVLLPRLNAFLDRSIVFDYWHVPMLASILALVLFVGALAGFYPALVLSAFRPSAVLKGTATQVAGSGSVRQMLVIAQFAVLIGLMLATAVVYRQTQFGLQQGLRFDKDQLLAVATYDCDKPSFRSAIESLPGVIGAACSDDILNNFGTGQYLGPDGREVTLQFSQVGAGMFELLGFKPLAGRFFVRERQGDSVPRSRPFPADATYRAVINLSASRLLGFSSPAQAVGKSFAVPAGERYEIIGVVADFSRDTIRSPIEPMFYENAAGFFSQINVKLRGAAVPETLKALDALWNGQQGVSRPIDRRFFDDFVQELYSGLMRQSAIFTGFSVVALLLAGLGLFGLAGFTVERRTKEIGIRKAMGAETGDVTRLLLWQFAKPVLWANVIAWPVGAYIMNRWLLGFAYRVDLEPWMFALASLVALLIAMLTVSTHSILVARANPVAALRYQ
jgi:putative ABC transport system permease protein